MSLREWMASFSRSNLVKVSSLGKTKTNKKIVVYCKPRGQEEEG